MGSEWATATFQYRPDEFNKGFQDLRSQLFYEYGHDTYGGTVAHGATFATLIGTLPARVTLHQFTTVADRLSEFNGEFFGSKPGTWVEFKWEPELNNHRRILHRTSPVPKSWAKNGAEALVKRYSKFLTESSKWDDGAIAVRLNAREEREWKKDRRLSGTQWRVAHCATWAPS